MISSNTSQRSFLYSLVLSNGLTAIIAVSQNWQFADIAWGCWVQSIMMAMFSFFKILYADYKYYIAKPYTNVTKTEFLSSHLIILGAPFLYYEGMYFLFLNYLFTITDVWPIIVMACIFFINNLIIFIKEIQNTVIRTKSKKIGQMVLFPLFKIAPINMIVFFGLLLSEGKSVNMIYFFTTITLVEVFMYRLENM